MLKSSKRKVKEMNKKHDKVIELFGNLIENAIKHPELTPDRVVIISLSEEEKNRILTPERLKLIRTIKKHNPKSVGKLAKLVDRRVDAVSRDLKILQNYGFLELLQIGKVKRPKIEKDILIIPLT